MDSVWQSYLPDCLLFEIFTNLDLPALGAVSRVCKSWYRVAQDNLLWQNLAKTIWKIKGPLSHGKTSWRAEVKRLYYHVPCVCRETVVRHTDEVLDVHISHDGRYFTTCSKDAEVVLWELGSSSHEVKSFDTGTLLRWQLTQYSVFSPDDKLLLVCGVKSYDDIPVDYDNYKAGVGAVFSIPDLDVVCLVEMDPPTMFGAWLNERTFLSGWPGTRADSVEILAYQLTDQQISNPVYKNNQPKHFKFGKNDLRIQYETFGTKLFCFSGSRYHLMNLLVANVSIPVCKTDHSVNCTTKRLSPSVRSLDCDLEKHGRKRTPDSSSDVPEVRKVKISDSDHDLLPKHGKETNSISSCAETSQICGSVDECYMGYHGDAGNANCANQCEDDISTYSSASNRKMYSQYDKQFVAFVTGNHDEIAVSVMTDKQYEILERGQRKGQGQGDNQSQGDNLDKIDHVFSIKDCYITGLCTSHDQRYLFFNYRELDQFQTEIALRLQGNISYNRNHEMIIPDSERIFCRELKIGCIDLVTMERVKAIEYQGHVGDSGFPAWYICIDASPDYIGSGSEDMRGYIWERQYGVIVARLFHSSHDTGHNTPFVLSLYESTVVNGIAFSPTDQETCITVCDDKIIKVWRSRNRNKCLGPFQRRYQICAL